MTLTGTLSDNLAQSSCVHNDTSNFNILYCSHLWSNSDYRQAVINPSCKDNKLTKYCYTCRGKIRNYGVTPPKEHFVPNNHSTPRVESIHERTETGPSEFYKKYVDDSYNLHNNFTGRKTSISDININNLEITQYIPTISRQVDSNSIRHKYTSEQYEQCENDVSQRRLSKSLNGIRCVVNWSLTESTKKRRTQIQACSISVMIIAIVVISLVLVNLNTFNNSNNIKNYNSTSLVPTENININENSSAIVNFYTDLTVPQNKQIMITDPTTPIPVLSTTKNNSLISNVIFKIRKNIKTYPKDEHKRQENIEPKILTMKNLTQRFCSCQTNEVCMLDEISGKSVCKIAVDIDDPTGCGGLCAMETEACHLVDKARGVRVCRLLTQVSCSSQDWRCRNGFCVPSEARCDGYIQCYDRSDEMHCECDLTKQFRCGHSISCFSNKKICDGFIDCWDGYDELNCTMECPENQFTCTNGQCITSSRFCDGLADCSDKSDEPQGCDGACGTREIQCNNHRCVPHGVQCDGRDDCGDGTDEFQCS